MMRKHSIQDIIRWSIMTVLLVAGLGYVMAPTSAQGETASMSIELIGGGNTVSEGRFFDVRISCAATSDGTAAFSCFGDLLYPSALFSFEQLTFDTDYPNFQKGTQATEDANTALINQLGAVANVQVNQAGDAAIPPSTPEVVVVRFRALATGNGTISLRQDDSVFSEVTLYGTDTDQRSNTLFGSLALTVEEVVCNTTTIGIYRDSDRAWFLRYANSTGFANNSVTYGDPADISVVGDWDGDGFDSIGIYRNNTFFLKNTNESGFADITVAYGSGTDIPVVGDWNGNGTDTIGVYKPATATWELRNSNTAGPPDIVFTYGIPNEIPLTGDWNGDGVDTIGIYRVSDRSFFLRNANNTGFSDFTFIYGTPSIDTPVVGDWNGDCTDTPGVYRGGEATWFLRNDNSTGFADLSFNYGVPNEKPVVGAWDQVFGVTAEMSAEPVSVSDAINVTSVCVGVWEIENPLAGDVSGTQYAYDDIGNATMSPFTLEAGSTVTVNTAADTTGLTLDFGGGDTLYTEAVSNLCE